MTFLELMEATDELQKVALVINKDVIISESCSLYNYIAKEVAEAAVTSISVQNGVLKVWVDVSSE